MSTQYEAYIYSLENPLHILRGKGKRDNTPPTWKAKQDMMDKEIEEVGLEEFKRRNIEFLQSIKERNDL